MRPDSTEATNPNAPSDFRQVVDAHWTSVYRMLYHLAGNTPDADDFTQETFLRALDRWQTFKPGTNLRAWLLRIAHNLFLDQRRHRTRWNVQPLEDNLPARLRAPEQALEQAEQVALLKAALETLSETTRLVFHLRTTEDLSFREIGELAGVSEEAARWHMHQARTRLLQRMREP